MELGIAGCVAFASGGMTDGPDDGLRRVSGGLRGVNVDLVNIHAFVR